MEKRKSKSKQLKKLELKHHNQMKESSLASIFHLSLTKFLVILGLWVFLVILHNFSSQLFGIDDPIFFLIAIVLIAIYLIKSAIYTLVHSRIYSKSRK